MAPRAAAPLAFVTFVAWRGLADNRMTAWLLVTAVACGSGFQITNTANLVGYRDALVDEGVASGFGDVRVRPATGSSFEEADGLAADLRRVPEVRAVVATLVLPGAVTYQGRVDGAPVIGIDRAAPARPFRLLGGRAALCGRSIGRAPRLLRGGAGRRAPR